MRWKATTYLFQGGVGRVEFTHSTKRAAQVSTQVHDLGIGCGDRSERGPNPPDRNPCRMNAFAVRGPNAWPAPSHDLPLFDREIPRRDGPQHVAGKCNRCTGFLLRV